MIPREDWRLTAAGHAQVEPPGRPAFRRSGSIASHDVRIVRWDSRTGQERSHIVAGGRISTISAIDRPPLSKRVLHRPYKVQACPNPSASLMIRSLIMVKKHVGELECCTEFSFSTPPTGRPPLITCASTTGVRTAKWMQIAPNS